MNWIKYAIVSIVILLISVVIFGYKSIRIPEKSRSVRPFYYLVGGVFLSAFFLMKPLYFYQYADAPNQKLLCCVSSVHQAIQLFTVDADRSILEECAKLPLEILPQSILPEDGMLIRNVYTYLLSAEYVIAPLLTFGFIISFFKNFMSLLRYCVRFACEKYVFSELNEKSLALAKSIKKNHPTATIVFTDVFERDNEASYELVDQARRIHAIWFRKDILQIHLGFHLFNKNMLLFIIGEDETENLNQAIVLMEKYNRPNVKLYLFSTRPESEYILNPKAEMNSRKKRNAYADKCIHVQRINEVQSLIYQNLYDQVKSDWIGLPKENIFSKAKKLNQYKNHAAIPISALVIGMGQHGTEMIKGLTWFCQMDGYRLSIHAYDKDPMAKEKFSLQCPDLMNPQFNGVYRDNVPYYNIEIHEGVDVNTKCFADLVEQIKDVTYVMICLGDDALNIQTAVLLRTIFERMPERRYDRQPIIQAVVYSSELVKSIAHMKDREGNEYNIDVIGDLDHSFDENVILNSELQHNAELIHLAWVKNNPKAESDSEYFEELKGYFWKYEYYYRSSCTSAIHRQARMACSIPTDDANLTASLEHRRWCAYMRGEGYIAGDADAPRASLAKTRHDMVSYQSLDDSEKIKAQGVSKPY